MFFKSENTYVFRKAGGSVSTALSIAFLVLCPAVHVSAGDTVEFNNGTVTGGQYINLWHNAPGFAYWGNSLVPNGDYQTNNWDGPQNVNRSHSLDGNTIILYSGLVSGSIFGAIDDTLDSQPHDVTNNRIIIHDGTVGDRPGATYVESTSGNVFGGWTRAGNALGNGVEIYGGTALGNIYGGLSNLGDATGNSVLIAEGGSVIVLNGNVYGGMSSNGGSALRNTVAMTSGSVGDYVYGGYSTYEAASENIVSISGGSVGQAVYGGWSRGGADTAIKDNEVTISGDTVIGSRPNGWGGYVYGGYTNTGGGVIESNEVALSGNVQVVKTYGLYGGSVYGGYAEGFGTAIKNNEVTISGNVLVENEVAGGYVSGSGTATGNTVNLSGGTTGGNIFGGYVSGNGTATGNTVNLSGGAIGGNVSGGYTGFSGDAFTGNTLNKNSAVSISVVQNFEFVNFGYSGDASITSLDTTPTGSTQPGVFVNTHANTVNFSGVISGTGSVIKDGAGTLILSATSASTYTGDTTVAAGTLQAGATNIFFNQQSPMFNVESAGTLDLAGYDQIIASLLNNSGIINMGTDTTPGTVLTVAGNYTGNNGIVKLNTALGDDNSATDRLHVTGNVTGTTTLTITNAGGAGAETVNGIRVAQVDGISDQKSPDESAPNANANFRLGNALAAGAYEYILRSQDESWYLVSRLALGPEPEPGPGLEPEPQTPIYRPGVSNYVGSTRVNAETGLFQMATLHQRVGEHRTLPLEKQSWARTYYNWMEEDGKNRFGYDFDIYGLQIGHELLAQATEDDGNLRAAVAFDYARSDASFNDRVRPVADLNRDTGSSKADSYALGGYLTRTFANDAYVDVVGQIARLKNRYDTRNWNGTRDHATQKGWRFGLSAEGGYPLWKQGNAWLLEGQGQLSYLYTRYSSFTDDVSRIGDYHADALLGRLGVRLARTLEASENRTAQAYGVANIYCDFLNPEGVPIGNGDGTATRVSERYGSSWGELGLGIQGWARKNTSVFGNVRYQHGFSSNTRQGASFHLGIRHAF